jgi:hypothetical protein
MSAVAKIDYFEAARQKVEKFMSSVDIATINEIVRKAFALLDDGRSFDYPPNLCGILAKFSVENGDRELNINTERLQYAVFIILFQKYVEEKGHKLYVPSTLEGKIAEVIV